jgi:predicted metal-dependent peptidase
VRCEGRDPYLWNIACDYVINGWLIEMGVGQIPSMGLLYDAELKASSAEAVYDMIVGDMRRFRKLATLRGVGLSDILGAGGDWWTSREGMDLDAFYRRCLSQGLQYHEGGGRGFLPGNMVEEIRALEMPIIPWDVRLGRWFDRHFAPLEKRRSYARQSRRQAATPDIPRPRYVFDERWEDGRTFGVVLDTSGSMGRQLLAMALGTIASYSLAHDVPAVRVVFCDAVAYDQGYMPPDAIAGKVRIKGRGGTILQPGINLIERAADFPTDGPLLIITDSYCDHVAVHRSHAYVMPAGKRLPFVPRGEVFHIS